MENSLFITVPILSWLLCDVCVHSQDNLPGQVTCWDPGEIAYGWRNGSARSAYESGIKLTYNCKGGFRIRGEKHITCLESGSWDHDAPECYKPDEGYDFLTGFYKYGLSPVALSTFFFSVWILFCCWKRYQKSRSTRRMAASRSQPTAAQDTEPTTSRVSTGTSTHPSTHGNQSGIGPSGSAEGAPWHTGENPPSYTQAVREGASRGVLPPDHIEMNRKGEDPPEYASVVKGK